MRRIATIIACALIALAVLSAVALGWRTWERSTTAVYTDGAAIQQPSTSARLHSILWQPPAALPEQINTSEQEFEPRLTADGRQLLFVRGKPGGNADIYCCDRDSNGAWGIAYPLDAINTSQDELGPEISLDGQWLIFYSDRAGGLGGYDLWRSQRINDEWQEPQNLGPAVNSPWNEYNAALTPDASQLFFTSNRPVQSDDGAQAETEPWNATLRENQVERTYDIYVSNLPNGEPTDASPVHTVNSTANDGSPAVSPSGDFLYFCSDRAGGLGGFDLYRSRILRGEMQPVEHLGPELNSRANELDPSLSMGGFAIHFSSDRAQKEDGVRRDYDIFYSESREVFLELAASEPLVDWASLVTMIAPYLPWLLLALLLLLLWALMRRIHWRRMSLIARCLLASLIAHLIIMMLLTFWHVSVAIAELVQGGGTKVVLTSDVQHDDVAGQVFASWSATEVEVPSAPSMRQVLEHTADDWQTKSLNVETASVQPTIVDSVAFPFVTEPADSGVSEPATLAASAAIPPAPAPEMLLSEVGLPAARTPVSQSETAAAATAAPGPATMPRAESQFIPQSEQIQPVAAANIQPLRIEPTASSLHSEMDVTEAVLSSSAPTVPQAIVRIDVVTPRDVIETALPSPIRSNSEASETSDAVETRQTFMAASTTRMPATATVSKTQERLNTIELSAPSVSRAEVKTSVTSPVAFSEAQAEVTSASRPVHSITPLPALNPVPQELTIALPSQDTTALTSQQVVSSAADSVNFHAAVATRAMTDPTIVRSPSLAEAVVTPPLPITKSPVQPASGAAHELLDEIMENRDIDGPLAQRHQVTVTPPAVALTEAATDVALPRNEPVNDQFAQRAEDVRQTLVQDMGGSDKTERAVALALRWLAAHQSDDGRWAARRFDDDCRECRGAAKFDTDVATTGLALLCFMGANHTHLNQGEYQPNVERGLKWLLSQQKSDGDLRAGETMYSQGIAAIALCEAFGMTRDPLLRDAAQRSVDFIGNARNMRQGGWRYEPGQPGDTSVLGWQIMALHSAKSAGLTVDKNLFGMAERWLDHVSSPERRGHYAYQPGQHPTVSMTAEGMFVQQLLGMAPHDHRMIQSADLVLKNMPRWRDDAQTYYWYYATLAMFQHQGESWRQWNEALTEQLLANQRTQGSAAGSWDPVDNWSKIGGRIYQTALCTLCLEVYYRYLPMYANQQNSQMKPPLGD